MTRFARAKGSKSSNERAPEDGTPWEVMKEQLLRAKQENEESKKRKEAEQQRIENYENFLKDRKVQKRQATWCDFPEVQQQKTKHNSNVQAKQNDEPSAKKKKKNKKASLGGIETASQNQATNNSDNLIETTKKNKKSKKENTDNQTDNTVESATHNGISENDGGKKKKKNKKKKVQTTIIESQSQPEIVSENVSITDDSGTKKKKKNKQNNSDKSQTPQLNAVENNRTDKPNPNQRQMPKKKKKKLVDGQPVRRKEINDRSFQLIINGKEVELVRFDGFPIMKKDAERLEELKTSMIKKGIPKSEVQRTIKLERRRAEKALARVKRDVCYNCRKGGHVLSDCPELKSKIPGAENADGVCFKCGSTEHRQFECKVQRSSEKEFRFATCFICKEPGHIARQCPDNPKGLYPNGGCCKLCGDVTHLRKDCPTVNEKKEETSFKLQILATDDGIEDVGQPTSKVTTQEPSKKPKKIRF